MGVFRIARAEFIKIFKKPSVYMMGVILAAVLVLSLLFFQPVGKQNIIVKLNGSTVGQLYDMFTNDSNPASGDIKKSNYDAQIAESLNQVNFYKTINERNESLSKVNGEFIILYNDLKTQISKEDNETKINETYTALKKKLDQYNTTFNNNQDLINNSEFYSHFTTLSIYSDLKSVLTELTNRSNDGSTPQIYVNFVENNNYIEKINSIYSINKNFVSSTINYYKDQIKLKHTEYYNSVINSSTSQTLFLTLKNNLKTEIENFSKTLKLLENDTYDLCFININNLKELNNSITEAISIIESYDDPNSNETALKKHTNIVTKLHNLNLPSKIENFNKSLINYSVSTETLNDLEKILKENVEELKNGINTSIETLNNTPSSENLKDINDFNNLITNYKGLALNSKTLVDLTINLEAVTPLNSNKIVEYNGFNDFNIYEAKENITRANYFIKNGLYNQDYNDVFAFNKNSGLETSAYDFMFYAMKIATLIITVFAIFMAASLMASEYDSGTIKLLAIRPFKRWKIITGKLLATMIFVLIFVLFSFLTSLVAGVCLYPLDNTTILAIFNSTQAFAIHPMLLMLLNIACIILEIFFYTVIALSISTMFRSYTAAISTSCIMFILALSLNILFGGAYWYSFIPFINADLFKFFGGSFLTTQVGGINQLFVPTLLTNANFYISLGIYGGTILILLIITYIVFKVKDF